MELRKDYILDRYVIVSSARGKRPFEFKKKETKKKIKNCFFCPGNEEQTPTEIGRLGSKKTWTVRWFPNKFPAVEPKGDAVIKKDNAYFASAASYGYHEVIAETPNHKKELADLTKKEIKDVLSVYVNRINELEKKNNIKYVSIFKNHGEDAGTSIIHSHSQVIAYNKLPNLVKEKIKAVKKFKHCPYCDIIKMERKSERRCFENKNFVAFTPYASRFHFEIWILPLKHIKSIAQMTNAQLLDLADILKKALQRLKTINAPYNMELFYSPKKENLHFHIEISPRLSILGGFEISTNDTINSVSPEQAARFYKGGKIV